MSQKLPERTQSYQGMLTDSTRWDAFEHRPGDIFVCTPPKSGTTWTQAICALLIFGTADHGKQIGNISPWYEATTDPIDECNEMMRQQEHRRFVRTHTPIDGIPYHSDCTYICVYRDFRDAVFLFESTQERPDIGPASDSR